MQKGGVLWALAVVVVHEEVYKHLLTFKVRCVFAYSAH